MITLGYLVGVLCGWVVRGWWVAETRAVEAVSEETLRAAIVNAHNHEFRQ